MVTKAGNDFTWGFDGRPAKYTAPDGWEFVRNWGDSIVDIDKIEADPKRRLNVAPPAKGGISAFEAPFRAPETTAHLVNLAGDVNWAPDFSGYMRVINPAVRGVKTGTDDVGVRVDFMFRGIKHRYYGHRQGYVVFREQS